MPDDLKVDQWLPERLARVGVLIAAEKKVYNEFVVAVDEWLDGVRSAILTPGGGPLRIDPLGAYSATSLWRELLDRFLSRAVVFVLRKAYEFTMGERYPFTNRPYVSRHLANVKNRLVNVPNELFAAVRHDLDAGIGNGESMAEIAKRIGKTLLDSGAEMWRNRALVIARTETISAYNGGTFDSFKIIEEVTGEEYEKVWLSTDDTRTRHTHVEADGQRVHLDSTFTVGSSTLAFPGDPTGPPQEVIQCRCTMLLVKPGEELDYSHRQLKASLTASALTWHAECTETFCRTPLHPGPCKGWKHTLKKVAPGAYEALERVRVAKLEAKRKAKIAALKEAGKPIPKMLLKPITSLEPKPAPPGYGKPIEPDQPPLSSDTEKKLKDVSAKVKKAFTPKTSGEKAAVVAARLIEAAGGAKAEGQVLEKLAQSFQDLHDSGDPKGMIDKHAALLAVKLVGKTEKYAQVQVSAEARAELRTEITAALKGDQDGVPLADLMIKTWSEPEAIPDLTKVPGITKKDPDKPKSAPAAPVAEVKTTNVGMQPIPTATKPSPSLTDAKPVTQVDIDAAQQKAEKVTDTIGNGNPSGRLFGYGQVFKEDYDLLPPAHQQKILDDLKGMAYRTPGTEYAKLAKERATAAAAVYKYYTGNNVPLKSSATSTVKKLAGLSGPATPSPEAIPTKLDMPVTPQMAKALGAASGHGAQGVVARSIQYEALTEDEIAAFTPDEAAKIYADAVSIQNLVGETTPTGQIVTKAIKRFDKVIGAKKPNEPAKAPDIPAPNPTPKIDIPAPAAKLNYEQKTALHVIANGGNPLTKYYAYVGLSPEDIQGLSDIDQQIVLDDLYKSVVKYTGTGLISSEKDTAKAHLAKLEAASGKTAAGNKKAASPALNYEQKKALNALSNPSASPLSKLWAYNDLVQGTDPATLPDADQQAVVDDLSSLIEGDKYDKKTNDMAKGILAQLVKATGKKPQSGGTPKKATPIFFPDEDPLGQPSLPAQSATPHAPPFDPSTLTKTGTTLGFHSSPVYVDPKGQQWLFKAPGGGNGFVAEVDVAAADLMKQVGLLTPDVYIATIDGKHGSLQNLLPAQAAFPNGFDPKKLTPTDVLAVQKQHVIDWLLGNHDAHADQFLRAGSGELIGIDKTQGLKYFGKDKLDPSYKPNEKTPIYNILWKAANTGTVAVHDPSTGELGAFIDKVQALPDAEFREMFRTYAQGAAERGVLPNNDVEAFLSALVARKNGLHADFAKLYADYTPSGAPPAVSAPTVPGTPVDTFAAWQAAKNIVKSKTYKTPVRKNVGQAIKTGGVQDRLITYNVSLPDKAEFAKLTPELRNAVVKDLDNIALAPGTFFGDDHKAKAQELRLRLTSAVAGTPYEATDPKDLAKALGAAPKSFKSAAAEKAHHLANNITTATVDERLKTWGALTKTSFASLDPVKQQRIVDDLREIVASAETMAIAKKSFAVFQKLTGEAKFHEFAPIVKVPAGKKGLSPVAVTAYDMVATIGSGNVKERVAAYSVLTKDEFNTLPPTIQKKISRDLDAIGQSSAKSGDYTEIGYGGTGGLTGYSDPTREAARNLHVALTGTTYTSAFKPKSKAQLELQEKLLNTSAADAAGLISAYNEMTSGQSWADKYKAALKGPAQVLDSAPLKYSNSYSSPPKGMPSGGIGGVSESDINDAVISYRGSGYVSINGALRNTKGDLSQVTSTGTLERIRALDAAFSYSKMPVATHTVRGISQYKSLPFFAGVDWDTNVAGLEWVEHGYGSTSTSVSKAENFAGYGGMIFKIVNPPGIGAIKLSGTEYESELLLQRGLKWRVLNDLGEVNGRRTLEIEVTLP